MAAEATCLACGARYVAALDDEALCQRCAYQLATAEPVPPSHRQQRTLAPEAPGSAERGTVLAGAA